MATPWIARPSLDREAQPAHGLSSLTNGWAVSDRPGLGELAMGKGSEIRSQMTEVRKTAEVPIPSQIYADIEAQPPLMRAEAARAYIGAEVDWPVTFADGHETDPGQARLSFRFKPNEVRTVVGEASLSRYPQLRSMRVGEPLHVRGNIHKINTLIIELDITDLLPGDQ